MSTKKDQDVASEETATVKETKVAKTKAAAKKTVDEIRKSEEITSQIYLGPNLPNNSLVQHAIFTNELPPYVQEHMEKCAAIKELLVPVSRLAEVSANLGVPGTKDQIMFEQISKYVRGEN